MTLLLHNQPTGWSQQVQLKDNIVALPINAVCNKILYKRFAIIGMQLGCDKFNKLSCGSNFVKCCDVLVLCTGLGQLVSKGAVSMM